MVTAAWGAFVVASMAVIRAEAERLTRRGVSLDVEDAVQEVALSLLDDEADEKAIRDHLRARVRSRLIDIHRAARSVKRGGGRRIVEIDSGTPDARSALYGLTDVSHEDAVIFRVDAEKLLDLWPVTTGGGQSAKEMRDRWLPRFQEFAKRGAA